MTAANITKYFSQFDESLLEIDSGTSYTKETDGNLNIRLNNSWGDKEYNKPESNERLKITPEQYKKFLPSGKFEGKGETAFKAYLQKVVLNIVESRGT
ncbi:MAG: hypothetical protein LBD75_05505 [Candidatus Peribacteria bacterium]|nr:hypothetical protein [Candidatus Peribacteria bacterium]